MEDFKVECVKEKPRTLEEFFVEKYQQLEEEIGKLASNNVALSQKCRVYENIIEELKEDFKVQLVILGDSKYIRFSNTIWTSHEEEKFNLYKNLFNLKEEGEEENDK